MDTKEFFTEYGEAHRYFTGNSTSVPWRQQRLSPTSPWFHSTTWRLLSAASCRYVLKEVIGKGSYGVVCSAVDTKTNEKVAIKKINNVFDHVSDATRILREIKLLRLLRHPGERQYHPLLRQHHSGCMQHAQCFPLDICGPCHQSSCARVLLASLCMPFMQHMVPALEVCCSATQLFRLCEPVATARH